MMKKAVILAVTIISLCSLAQATTPASECVANSPQGGVKLITSEDMDKKLGDLQNGFFGGRSNNFITLMINSDELKNEVGTIVEISLSPFKIVNTVPFQKFAPGDTPILGVWSWYPINETYALLEKYQDTKPTQIFEIYLDTLEVLRVFEDPCLVFPGIFVPEYRNIYYGPSYMHSNVTKVFSSDSWSLTDFDNSLPVLYQSSSHVLLPNAEKIYVSTYRNTLAEGVLPEWAISQEWGPDQRSAGDIGVNIDVHSPSPASIYWTWKSNYDGSTETSDPPAWCEGGAMLFDIASFSPAGTFAINIERSIDAQIFGGGIAWVFGMCAENYGWYLQGFPATADQWTYSNMRSIYLEKDTFPNTGNNLDMYASPEGYFVAIDSGAGTRPAHLYVFQYPQ